MGELSKTMRQALDTVSALPAGQQDLLAADLIESARLLAQPPTRLSREERAELEAELTGARRGAFASDTDVAAMYARHGV